MEYNIGPCGINCDLCHAYQQGNCPGCRQKTDDVRKSRCSCVILKCDKYTRYCYECGKLCKRLKSLNQRYQTKYGVYILHNLSIIHKNGEAVFIAGQTRKYTCQKCGNLRTVHYDYCIYCKILQSKTSKKTGE